MLVLFQTHSISVGFPEFVRTETLMVKFCPPTVPSEGVGSWKEIRSIDGSMIWSNSREEPSTRRSKVSAVPFRPVRYTEYLPSVMLGNSATCADVFATYTAMEPLPSAYSVMSLLEESGISNLTRTVSLLKIWGDQFPSRAAIEAVMSSMNVRFSSRCSALATRMISYVWLLRLGTVHSR